MPGSLSGDPRERKAGVRLVSRIPDAPSAQRPGDPLGGGADAAGRHEPDRRLDLRREEAVRAGAGDLAAQLRDDRARSRAPASRCRRSWIPRAAVRTSIASTRVRASTARRSLRAADQPIETWSSCIAELGIESTDAGTASRLSSETRAACVYWAIM